MYVLTLALANLLYLATLPNTADGGGVDNFSWGDPFVSTGCALNDTIVDEIASYKVLANRIHRLVKNGTFKYKFYIDLLVLVDTFGSRLSGSEMFEKSLAYMYQEMKRIGLDNVHSEPVSVPNWTREDEQAYMLTPRFKKIAIVGFGKSAPTPPEGITAEVIVIPSFKFLRENHARVAGKIAVFDLVGQARRRFKLIGGPEALKAGAVAALGRSVVSMSVYTVSARNYSPDVVAPIPIASITNEDMDLFVRLAERGDTITLIIKLTSSLQNVTSKNVMGDYMGKEDGKPDEVLIVGGHMDSWDISQGAQDNGCGSMLALEIPQVFANLSIHPRRTIRTLLSVASEYNFLGTRQYINSHIPENGNLIGALIADAGCAKPQGYILSSRFPKLGCVLLEISKLFEPSIIPHVSILLNNETYTMADVYTQQGVPNVMLNGDAGQYFWVRHTFADSMTHIDFEALDDVLVFWATTTFVLADMQNKPEEL